MFLILLIVFISVLLLFHSIFNLLVMIHSWNDPYTLHLRKSPRDFLKPQKTFSILVPVRNEASVIGYTLTAMSEINYPKDLYEIVILCREDDAQTLEIIDQAKYVLKSPNTKLITLKTNVDNKPKALNIGLSTVTNEFVAVFDAEDEPHPDILNVINSVLIQQNSDVVQAGVQLINFKSRWFSTLNVLEYYFWFKSALHFFTKLGVVPLGGNTVFIKRKKLIEVGGWDESKLTEDADLGIRLSIRNAKFSIVYDEEHVTKEEAPSTISELIKQRTRWNQGFLQIFFDFKWLRISGTIRKIFTAYLLFMPIIQALWIVYLPLTILANFKLTLPVGLAMFTLLPGYVLFIHFVLCNYGLYEFTKDYNYKWSPILIGRLLVTFFPYQFLLTISAIRAFLHLISKNGVWEKTTHLNIHRLPQHAS